MTSTATDRMQAHFAALDREPLDDHTIPGQITVDDVLADASLPLQGDRCRDEQAKTESKLH